MDALLLHGFTNTGACWDPVRAALPRGYRAITPDLRGHGTRAEAVPVGLAEVLEDLVALAPAEPFVLGGYSQGGRIALHLALDPRLRGRVARLVLIGASPGIADTAQREARRAADKELARAMERMRIEELADRWARTPMLAGLPAELATAARDDRLRSTPEGLARALRGLGTGTLEPLWDRLGELEVEVVLVAGARDAKFTELARQMAARLKRARVEIVPGAGHAVHLEAPEAVAALLAGEANET